ncbi:MAG: nuclear transport factor 2 family protein [Planctomycetota bacterium]
MIKYASITTGIAAVFCCLIAIMVSMMQFKQAESEGHTAEMMRMSGNARRSGDLQMQEMSERNRNAGILQTTAHIESIRNGDDETINEIESLLRAQDECWNNGDIEGFMSTYWQSEELTFSSGGQTTRGWQQTLDRYKARYHPPENMGRLNFDGLETTLLNDNSALVLGNWHLVMADGEELDGNFTLVLRKTDTGWKIIHDHSSTLEKDETSDADNG